MRRPCNSSSERQKNLHTHSDTSYLVSHLHVSPVPDLLIRDNVRLGTYIPTLKQMIQLLNPPQGSRFSRLSDCISNPPKKVNPHGPPMTDDATSSSYVLGWLGMSSTCARQRLGAHYVQYWDHDRSILGCYNPFQICIGWWRLVRM